jgi:hypothetical protein
MPAVLRDRPGVPIARVGTWSTSSGEWECTAEQLRDAVLAQHDPAFRAAVLKIGHRDERFTDGEVLGDGEPAVGRVVNLRLDETGQTLVADLVGIPAWLDEVLESAYPSRSVEAALGVQTPAGATYAMVVTGCALLGVTAPAIQSLGDIAALYGQDTSVEAYVAASRVAAAALPQEEHMPPVRELGQVVMASASIDELTRQFEEWAEDQPLLGGDCWVRDIYTDYLVATVWRSGGDSLMYQVPWSETGGQFTFGTPSQVRPTYEPVPTEAAAAAGGASGARLLVHDVNASRARREPSGAVLSARGRAVAAGGQTDEEYRVPIKPAIAELLGVAEDADDEAVEAAARALREKADATPPAATTPESGQTTTPAAADIEQLVAAKVAAATAPILASLATTTSALTALTAKNEIDARDALIASAITDGKIAPADRGLWETQYALPGGPGIVSAILAGTPKNARVPVTATGHAGGETSSDDEALYAQLFGEKASA